MRKSLKLTVCLFLICSISIAQEECIQYLDSAQYHIYTSRDYAKAIEKIKQSEDCEETGHDFLGRRYFLAARAYYYDYQDSASVVNYLKAIKEFRLVPDSSSIAKSLNSLGNLTAGDGFYDSAITFFDESISIQNILKDTLGLAIAFNNKGNAHTKLGNYDKGLSALYQSLSYYKMANASDRRLSISMLNIGASLDALEKPDKAIDFYKQSAQLKRKIGDSVGIAKLYNNIGVIKKNSDQADSAFYFYEQSMNFLENKKAPDLRWDILINMANLYVNVKQFDKGLKAYSKALEIGKALEDFSRIGASYYGIGNHYLHTGDTVTAVTFLEEALPYAKKTKSFEDLKDVYQNLASGYFAKGEYKKAFAYGLKRDQYKDSVYKEAKALAIEDVVVKYETEKKDQAIILLNNENALQRASLERNTVFIVALISLIVLISIIFYLIRYRSKQRHRAVIQEQKIKMREAQMQAVIDSQEKERKRFATDLHDGMGQLVAALQLNIQSFKEYKSDIKLRDKLYENSTNLLQDIHTEIRNTAFNLMPQTLVKEGLVAAVEELANRINKSNQISVQLTVLDMDFEIGEVIEISIYRIIQELLSNIMKYSKAKQIYLGLSGFKDECVVTLEDDGIGYDLENFKNNEGNGWRNINSRLNLIKGEIEIDTKEGRDGTSTVITFPLVSSQLKNQKKIRDHTE